MMRKLEQIHPKNKRRKKCSQYFHDSTDIKNSHIELKETVVIKRRQRNDFETRLW